MSSRLDYAKAKRRVAPGMPPWPGARIRDRGWRTEYPEEFPVTVTRKDSMDDDQLRPQDGNGHVPATPEPSATGQLCPYQDAERRLVWLEGYLACIGVLAAQGQKQLDAVLGGKAA